MSTEIVTELVNEKNQLEAVNHQLIAVLGAVVAGKNGTGELRISKATMNKMADSNVQVRGLKTGGVVVTVKKKDDE